MPAKPSGLLDIESLDRTEIESINGAVVVAARELNVPVVHTEILLQLVRLVEARNTELPNNGLKEAPYTSAGHRS